jgi:FkbM family methyltransferase
MRRLIYDVGMHNGSDTEFYLRKDFNVIAIEANPDYVTRARQRFNGEIAAGRLIIYDVALTDAPGEVAFFVHEHDDWSRTNLAYDDRFAEGTYREIKVHGMRFSEIARAHPQPYYIKLDIEGPERMVIEQMFSIGIFPPFLSFEVNTDTFAILGLVLAHGYEDFQLLAQRDKSKLRLPNPSLEGRFYEACFDGYMSGPFGLELPGPWVSAAQIRATLEAHNRKIAEGAAEDVYNEWFDVHARHRNAAPRRFLGRLADTFRAFNRKPASWVASSLGGSPRAVRGVDGQHGDYGSAPPAHPGEPQGRPNKGTGSHRPTRTAADARHAARFAAHTSGSRSTPKRPAA